MKHTRLLGAALMGAAALAILAGYSAAGPDPQPIQSPAEMVPNAAPVQPKAREAWLMVAVDEIGSAGPLTLSGEELTPERIFPNERGEYVLELVPGNYCLSGQALTTEFSLAENASVINVAGDGWTDGELLHLDTAPRCTLRVLHATAQPVVCTLTGGTFSQSQSLTPTDLGAASAVFFPGLAPGRYTLSTSDGVQRTVFLTLRHPHKTIGLD